MPSLDGAARWLVSGPLWKRWHALAGRRLLDRLRRARHPSGVTQRSDWWQRPPAPMYPQTSSGRGCFYAVLAVIGLGLLILIVIIIAVVVVASHSTRPASGSKTHSAAADITVAS
jgi:hypothetical protein